MLIVQSGAEAITAMQKGAPQSASITVYDMTSVGHPSIISFTNANILSGSLTVSKASSTYDELELGGMISDELRVGVRSAALSSLSIEGQEISVAISWEHTGRYSPDSLYVFSGIVVEVMNQKDDIYYITALDPCIVFDKRYTLSDLHDYDNANLPMTYPVTVYKLMQNIIRDIGAPYIETRTPIQYATPVNTSVSISGIDESQGYTYRQILKWCAQIMGVNLRVNHSPTRPMEMWRWKGASAALQVAVMVERDNAYSITVGREDKTYGGIDVIYGDETLYEDVNAGEHLQVADNPLLATLHEELSLNDWTDTCWNVAHEIHECLGSYYNSASLRCTSMWYLEPGDLIQVYRASSSSYVVTPITSVTHKLNGGTTIKAAVSSTATGSYGNMQAFSGLQVNRITSLEQRMTSELNARVLPLSTDYIIEEGTSGIWAYRKWNSGVSEGWLKASGNITMADVSSQDGIGGLYYNPSATSDWYFAYPSYLFIDVPIIEATAGSNKNTLVSVYANSSGFVPRFWTPYTSSTTLAMTLNIYAVGRWKN